MNDKWIVIPNWDKFQQYHNRDPVFIKDYREQLLRDEYRQLSFHLRGILQGLRLSYAATNGQLRDNTVALTRQLGHRVTRRDLESLNHAGLIRFRASKPLALTRSREKRVSSKEETQREESRRRAPSATTPPAHEKNGKAQAAAYKQNAAAHIEPVEVDPAAIEQARAWLKAHR